MFEKIIEKIAKAPAVLLEKTLDTSIQVKGNLAKRQGVKKAEEYWKMLGPGLTTGAADDDPSGIATYSQTGARYGFKFLWTAPLTFPLMAVVQEMCARIGLVTGQGLAANIKDHYSRRVVFISTVLLFMANTFNIGADLGAMAKATQLLFPGASFFLLLAGFAVATLLLQIFTTYAEYAKYLKWLSVILLAYVFSALSVGLNWGEVWKNSLLPSFYFSKTEIILVAAVLGTTISPYLFFWQTSQEVEEEILKGKEDIEARKGSTKEEINKMRFDVWVGMFISNLVMFFIIAAAAAALFRNGITNIVTAADAAEALKPFAGSLAYLVFTLGIVSMGLLAVPVLAGSASYAISESFGWPEGLFRKLKEATAFYGTIIISMAVGLAINFIGLDSIKALIYSAVLNAFVAPVVLAFIVQLSSKKEIMGEWASRPFTAFLGWLIVAVMSAVTVATVAALM